MTHELILTSVAQGVNSNNHGFFPVATDAAISPEIVTFLSNPDAFRSLVAESITSSVVYAHFLLPDRTEHVLSRMTAVGTAVPQQPNVLTHHIILDEPELVPEGPAWLLALPGFHCSEWTAPPLQFTQGRPIPTLTNPLSLTRRQQIARQYRWLDPHKMALSGSADTASEFYLAAIRGNENQITLAAPPTSPCPVWNELTGDAGWGGVLAETVFTEQPIVLIYHPGQNILPLFVEALSLLPPYSSWRTTFCTCASALPDTILCQWSGVKAGSDKAKELVKDSNNLVIDFTAPIEEAPMGKYVDFARHGQESLLPLDAEEYATALINADTKAYGEEERDSGVWDPSHVVILSHVSDAVVPTVTPPIQRAGLLDSFLRRSTRTQFYALYSIMFALVCFVLIVLVDQAGEFGIMQKVQHWIQPTESKPHHKQEPEIASELEAEIEAEQEENELDTPLTEENALKILEKNRQEQKEPLRLFLDKFDIPEYLAVHFPDVQDNLVDLPAKITFDSLSLLYPFGSALELWFIPLFDLPYAKVETRLLLTDLPELVWEVTAIDAESRLNTPMFHFHLTESGLEMDWQPAGLNNQHLYDTVFLSLGILQLSVADRPETVRHIPLFAPVKTEPVKIADLASRAESETPEYVVELPFASEFWQRIFSETPSPVLRLEVWTEPAADWARVKPSPVSEFSAEVRTSQQVGKPTEGGDTAFENIDIPFVAKASLKSVVWKMADYAGQLRLDREKRNTDREGLEKKTEPLVRRAFEGDEQAKAERDANEAKLRDVNLQIKTIENILERLPEAYKELGQDEERRFHYSLFLESAERERTLLILTTGHL